MGVGCDWYIFLVFFSWLCGQIEVVMDAWGSCVRLLVWIKKTSRPGFSWKVATGLLGRVWGGGGFDCHVLHYHVFSSFWVGFGG